MERDPSRTLEMNGMVGLLDSGQLSTLEKVAIVRAIEAHRQRIAQGAAVGRGTHWEKKFQEIDPDLRLRMNLPEGPDEIGFEVRKITGDPEPYEPYWVVDRWVQQWMCWAPVLHICNTDGPTLRRCEIDEGWVQRLRQADMQAAGNAYEYTKAKREAADKRQDELRKQADDRVCSAVDSLSEKQVRTFVEVERAMATGEKIRAEGKDADFLNRVWDRQKQSGLAPLPVGQSVNPGMNPRLYRRKRRG